MEVAGVGGRRSIAGAVRRQPLAAVGVGLLLLFVVCAVFAPWLAPQDPAQLDLTGRLMGPSAAHWFGTDELGRDILSRTLFGARISLIVAVSVVGLSLAVGLLAGGLAGFYGGWTDTVVNVYVTNAFMALPGILLAIAFVAFMGPGLGNVILALAISGWVGYARLVRAQVMAVKEKEFVEAARALGASQMRIVVRHILPNIVQPLIVQAAIGMAMGGWMQSHAPSGAVVAQGICFYQSYAREMAEAKGWTRLMTNSAKLVNILGGYGYRSSLASLERCVASAVAGKVL